MRKEAEKSIRELNDDWLCPRAIDSSAEEIENELISLIESMQNRVMEDIEMECSEVNAGPQLDRCNTTEESSVIAGLTSELTDKGLQYNKL
jgi:hypothetical protein